MGKFTKYLPIAVLVAAGFYLFASNYEFKEPKPVDPAAVAALVKTDKKLGSGDVATAGKTVSVHYTGWLYDDAASGHQGAKFDSSRDRNQPFDFSLGAKQVIPGWEMGVEGMKVGGQRLLIIPAELGYGARGAGGVIPPNAKLVFDIELIAVK
jgi:FKBP-type peptidyl-prolyl cis-trans isomerase